MANLADLAIPLVGERPPPLFLALLSFHVAAGLTCVVAGAGAALSRKRPGRHPMFGKTYLSSLAVVFISSTGMSLLRWSQDAPLFVLGALAFAAGLVGYSARKIRWEGWPAYHITGMGVSYIVLLTAFYVDNGSKLPLWNRLPNIAFWTVPALIGLPLIVRALRRHARLFVVPRHSANAPVRGRDGSRL